MSPNYLRNFAVRRLALGACLVALFAAGGCGGSSTPTSPTPPTNPPTNPPTPAALSMTCPAAMSVPSPNGAPVAVTFTTPTTSEPAVVSCTPASGAAYPVGTTTVQCTATAANQTASCSFGITITAPLPTLTKTNFLAFGDSMTQGEVTSPVATSNDANGFPSFTLQLVPTAAYPRQLQLLLSARYTQQTIQMTNAGVSGETATQGAQRFPGVMSSMRPEVVLLLDGANDLAALGEAGFSTAIAGVESMAKEARFRNARVFLGNLPPPRPGGRNTISASTIQAFNARLASIARGEGAVLVDLNAAMAGGVTTYIGTDGLHPTEAGYQKMAETFFAAIRADLEVRFQQ